MKVLVILKGINTEGTLNNICLGLLCVKKAMCFSREYTAENFEDSKLGIGYCNPRIAELKLEAHIKFIK
ncbi:MAG: hypothetical protein E7613_05320 [Ruminococcaceae bacterium]|nr:hypothetical protein [Oscillospiraceae bacterium]